MQEQKLTGYPSVDKPWLKYYAEKSINQPCPRMTAYEYLCQLNAQNQDKIAIRFAGNQITYRDLIAQIDQVAQALCAIGVKPGEIVMAYLPPTPEEIYLFYAVDKIGGCITYIIPETPIEEICALANSFCAKRLFISAKYLDDESYIYEHSSISNIIKVGICDAQSSEGEKRTMPWPQFVSKESDNSFYQRGDNEPLFIAKTGGTTGIPKNVVLSDKGFNSIVHQCLHSSLDYKRGDKWLRLWPVFSATAAVASNHLPLCAGMELCLDSFDPYTLPEIILNLKPNHFPLTPAILDILINCPALDNADLSFLKTVGCGGMPMTEEFEGKVQTFFDSHKIRAIIGCGYGMTENSSIATVRMNQETAQIGSVGIPLANTIVGIFDPRSLDELPYDTEGEICIYSESLMLGYYNDKGQTDLALKEHDDGKIWLHSGDIGYINRKGLVFVKDRIKRVINIFPSDKVYPVALEALIGSIPDIRSVAVVGVPDLDHAGFELPACYIISYDKARNKAIQEKVMTKCRNSLPTYALPKYIYFRDAFPLITVGKIDYQKLIAESQRN